MLLIVWHSRTGGARAMAEAAHAGAGNQSTLVPAEQATPERFLAARGYLFVCPENLATMSGAMKEMFDRCYYPLLGRIEGRPYASMIAAGSDGTGAERQLDRICTGWRLRRIAPSMIVNFAVQTPEAILAQKTVPEQQLAECRQLGESFSEGLAAGIF
jgi:multimeric flavodoxin WrbA